MAETLASYSEFDRRNWMLGITSSEVRLFAQTQSVKRLHASIARFVSDLGDELQRPPLLLFGLQHELAQLRVNASLYRNLPFFGQTSHAPNGSHARSMYLGSSPQLAKQSIDGPDNSSACFLLDVSPLHQCPLAVTHPL